MQNSWIENIAKFKEMAVTIGKWQNSNKQIALRHAIQLRAQAL